MAPRVIGAVGNTVRRPTHPASSRPPRRSWTGSGIQVIERWYHGAACKLRARAEYWSKG